MVSKNWAPASRVPANRFECETLCVQMDNLAFKKALSSLTHLLPFQISARSYLLKFNLPVPRNASKIISDSNWPWIYNQRWAMMDVYSGQGNSGLLPEGNPDICIPRLLVPGHQPVKPFFTGNFGWLFTPLPHNKIPLSQFILLCHLINIGINRCHIFIAIKLTQKYRGACVTPYPWQKLIAQNSLLFLYESFG